MTSFTSILAAADFSVDGDNAVRRAALLTREQGARLKLMHVLDPAGSKPLRDWFAPAIEIDLKVAQVQDSLRRFAVEIAGRYDVAVSVEVTVGEPHPDGVLRGTDVPEHVIRESRLRQAAGTVAHRRRKAARLGLDNTRMGFAVAHGHPVWSSLGHAHELGADLIVAGKQGRSTLGEFLLGSVSRRLLAESDCDMLIVPRPRNDSLAHTAAPHRRRLPEPAAQVDATPARSEAARAGASTSAP